MAIKIVSDSSFCEEVLKSDIPVIVDFWAEWCAPCKAIAPSLEKISDELKEQVKIVKLNIDDNQKTPVTYGVRGIPTLIVFKNGNIHAKKVGAMSESQLKDWIKGLI
ncbi:Thioredoxin [Candidatus Endolissoclinum faulkneri L5]|uniref:Thioredoxin n=1 Tax=Candidatus Endolissoclinum faulkneri L5 TaxID=1401328 RepID=V9TV18_9PROT|nr:thioredoxin [Candidatus Endolissoclinum faulkneri]AHC73543.1 Thioredoxin [Candidatus Endolissoclinum faulkneri L5]